MAIGAKASSESKNPEASATAEKRTPEGWYKYWEKELVAAEKRLRRFLKQGNKVVERFLDERGGQNDQQSFEGYRGDTPARLNLFHTNIKTLQSMLYGSTPKIEVSREHQDPDDDIARVASLLYQRLLQADVEASGDNFATCLKSALSDRLLPGLGHARVVYEVKTAKGMAANIESGEEEEQEQFVSEMARAVYVHWQDFRWGWCRSWSEMPWQGYRVFMDKEEATARFGDKKANKLEYKNQLPTGQKQKGPHQEADIQNNVQKAEIWELWHKFEKKVFWWSQGTEIILDAKDDPYKLDGFWPSPKPMMANLTTTLFVPKADFVIAQDLYNEIDTLQSRISTITRACKVVGVYDKNAGDSVGRMLKEGVENDLIPVDNWAMFAEKGGLQGTTDWFPLQTIVEVLTQLRALLGETIELLYQVTGMSDILRGANTDQYTSDGTNQLKAKFGSIRVQALQDEFARFASDLENLKAEIVSKHYDPVSILKQSNARYLPQPDLEKIPEALELMQSPDVKWRVNIRPESIAMIDYAQLKNERTEYLKGMATYLQSASTMAKAVPESMPVLLEMLKWGMAGFKGSNYLEGIMDRAIEMAQKAPPPKDDQKDQQKAQADAQLEKMKHEGAMKLLESKVMGEMKILQAKGQAEMQTEQNDLQTKIQEENQKHQNDMQKLMTDLRADLQVIAAKLSADLQVEQAQAAYAMEEEDAGHDNVMEEKREDAKMEARQQDRQASTD